MVALAPRDEYSTRLEAMGCRFVPLPIDNKGTNPVADAALFLRYLNVLRRERPVAFLGYTIKPNVYGSLACHALGIPVINNVSGLGTAFIRENWLTQVVKHFYRTAFDRSHRVFFQNDEDRQLFIAKRLVDQSRTRLVPGSGIDLQKFQPQPPRATKCDAVRFLLIARLLLDKGIGEYVEAARILRNERPRAHCALLGFLDVENRTAVKRSDVEAWIAEGIIDYLGSVDNVSSHIAASDCVVLPSYREGTPRTLLEAAAMAKPLIATDVPGCREVVEHGVTGLLCEARNAKDLAAKMIDVIDMSAEERQTMGAAGRAKMERQFDERLVIDAYLDTLRSILSPVSRNWNPAISY